MNLVSLVGRLTKDPELKYTTSGKAVATFTLAVQKEYKREEDDFIKCIIWGKGAETINEHLIKGKRLAVQGRLSVRKYEQKNETTGKPSIGVMSALAYDKQGIISAIKIGFQQTYELTVLLLSSLGILISGGASVNDLAGPVGITKLIGEAAQAGMVLLLSFTAFLSINLGVLNLLPIPALDGSRIVFALVEAIRRKPLEPEKEGFIHWLGFLFLIMLMVLVTYNDIVRLIKG